MKSFKVLSLVMVAAMVASCDTPEVVCDGAASKKPTDIIKFDAYETDYAFKVNGELAFNAYVKAYAVIFRKSGNLPVVIESIGEGPTKSSSGKITAATAQPTDVNGKTVLKFENKYEVSTGTSTSTTQRVQDGSIERIVVQFEVVPEDVTKTVVAVQELSLWNELQARIDIAKSTLDGANIGQVDYDTCSWNHGDIYTVKMFQDVNLQDLSAGRVKYSDYQERAVKEIAAYKLTHPSTK